MTSDKLSEKDVRFQEVLHALTGVEPPKDFLYEYNCDVHAYYQQSWAATYVKPEWACGISLLDAAKMFVDEAIGNSNLREDGAIKL